MSKIQALDLPSVSCVALDRSLNLSGTVSPSLSGGKGAVITSLQGSFEDQKRNCVCERANRSVVRNKTQRREGSPPRWHSKSQKILAEKGLELPP